MKPSGLEVMDEALRWGSLSFDHYNLHVGVQYTVTGVALLNYIVYNEHFFHYTTRDAAN